MIIRARQRRDEERELILHMMTVDDMLSEVAKIVDTAPRYGKDAEKAAAPKKKEAVENLIQKVPEKTDKIPAAEKVPAAVMGETGAVNMKVSIGLSLAKEIAYCIEKAAGTIGVNVVTAVADAGGNLILLEAMDDSYIASVNAAREKAYTAVALKMPTHEALKESRGGALDGYTNGGGILMLGGGYPIVYNGMISGGIGVSGGTKEQDMLLARIGTEYFKKRINSL